jgi:D-arabinose 1-dehydrogenase-like Zn-dependent alcohol dehydrogenase
MLAYRITQFGAPLTEMKEANPAPKGTEVLLKMTGCGVCHSDVHIWEGHFDMGGGRKVPAVSNDTLPLAMGHEVAGEVVAVGPEATGVKVGDRRVVYPWIGCGQCATCKAGDEHLCNKPRAVGVNIDGGFADHVLVPHGRYLLDYTGVEHDLACTFACSGLTAFSALKKIGKLGDGQPLLIIGAGGVGLAGVKLAKAVTGVAPIVADIDDKKLELARAAGASDVINSTAADAVKRLVAQTGGGVAGAVDFVGAESSTRFGTSVLRKGGKLVIVGLFGGSFTVPVPMFPFRSWTVQGSMTGRLDELQELLELGRKGLVQSPPISNRPLAQAGATVEDLKAGRILGRVVLHP